MIEGHGDDIYLYGEKIISNFSTNIFQSINHEALKKHLASCLDSISNYPEPAPYSVERLLSDKLGIPKECVMVTNGAAEAIHIVARATEGKTSAVLQPTFAEYADACRILSHKVSSFRTIDTLPARSELVWICNPNNPTGKVIDVEILHKTISNNAEKTFVIDQAYHKYTDEPVLQPKDILRHKNLILLYSMTKDYAIPGLRIGYAVANREIINSLKTYRIPWSVNALAIEAAKFMLQRESVSVDVDILLKEARRVADTLTEIGIYVEASQANFMLCHLPKGCASELKCYLIEQHGILIRDASNFEGLSPQHFRIAVQTPIENDILIKAIERWMHS